MVGRKQFKSCAVWAIASTNFTVSLPSQVICPTMKNCTVRRRSTLLHEIFVISGSSSRNSSGPDLRGRSHAKAIRTVAHFEMGEYAEAVEYLSKVVNAYNDEPEMKAVGMGSVVCRWWAINSSPRIAGIPISRATMVVLITRARILFQVSPLRIVPLGLVVLERV